MIIGKYSGVTYEPTEQPKPHRRVESAQDKPLCSRCELNPMSHKGQCTTCAGYKNKYGIERPFRLIERARERRKRPRWCGVCGHPSLFRRHRCTACHMYFMRHHKERPARFWNDDFKCLTCGYPKKAARRDRKGRLMFYGGRCTNCYDYLNKYGKERAKELWGIGACGWCDCGYPAEHQIDGFNLCNRCVKEFR